MLPRILLVDDDESILRGYYRNLQDHFQVEISMGGESALRALEEHGPFAVMVSDMCMPGMSGLELLKVVKERWPDMIRIMLTGKADQSVAADAVNQGEVFRFLTKPCDVERLHAVIQAGLQQFQLLQSEKTLLGKTLMGSLRVLTELLSLVDPPAYLRAQAIRERALLLAESLGMDDDWTLAAASMLAPLGYAIFPQEWAARLRERKTLSPAECAISDRIPELGARLVENIPRMEEVSRIIRYQNKGYDGSGYPSDGLKGEQLPVGARILKVASDFTDHLLSRKDAHVVMESMKMHRAVYDPAMLSLAETHLDALSHLHSALLQERALAVAELREGLVLSRDVQAHSGQVVLPAGFRLEGAYLEILAALGELACLQEPIHVYG